MAYISPPNSVVPYRNEVTVNSIDGNFPAYTLVDTGNVTVRSFQRSGYNDPRNFHILNVLGRTKPKRVRFYIKKVVVGYYFKYKKSFVTIKRRKRVWHGEFQTVGFKWKYYLRKKGKKKGTIGRVRKPIIRKVYSYVTTHRTKTIRTPYRVPIKARVRVPVVYKGEARELLPGSSSRPYLVPNQLQTTGRDLEIYPDHYTHDQLVPARIPDNNEVYGYYSNLYRGGPVMSHFYRQNLPVNDPVQTDSVGIGFYGNPTNFDFPLPPVDDIFLSATALHGLYSKVASDIPSTLTSLAELPESLKALYGILVDGIKLAKSLRHLDARQAYRTVNARVKQRKDSLSGLSSKVWLSWYLAISPTVSDIAEHISLTSREDRLWRKYSKSAVERTFDREDLSGLPDVGTYYHANDTMTAIKWSVIINGRMTIDQFKRKVTHVDNYQAAAYAVVPFSFIADWIVDISTYLESASIFQGLDYDTWKTSVRSEIESIKTSRVAVLRQDSGFPPIFVHAKKPQLIRRQAFRVNREVIYGGLPDMPLIPWKKKLVNETKINRSLTAAALFRVLSSKKN